MVLPGSRRLLGRVVGPVAGRRLGVDVEALRAGLAVTDRTLDRVLVLGDPDERELRKLGLPDPFVLVGQEDPRRAVPDTGEPVRGGAGRLPFADGSLDGVVVTSLTRTEWPVDGSFAEAARVLGTGGVLVVAGADPSTLRGRAVRAGGLLLGGAPMLLTPEEVSARMEAAGLSPEVAWPRWRFATVGVRPAGSARP